MIINKTYETKRLKLKDISLSDSSEIVIWRQNPDVYKYFLNPHKISLDEHIKWFNNIYIKDNTRVDFILLLNDTKIGVFGLKNVNSIVELSYLLDENYQGHGYASEALLKLMEIAKEIFMVKSACVEIHKNNISSIRLAKRLNFKFDSENKDFIIMKREI